MRGPTAWLTCALWGANGLYFLALGRELRGRLGEMGRSPGAQDLI
jgi:hypothetical protein